MVPQGLDLLVDENVSPRVVTFLREKGGDVIDVKEKGWYGADDKFLMAIALEEKRFILTHDRDFGTLAIHEGVPCYGIIYLRLKDLKVGHVIEVLDKFLKMEKEMAERTIIILTDRHLRIRPIVP